MDTEPIIDGTLLCVLGDTHCGSTVGLMRPRKQYEVSEGVNISANSDQRALWKRFEQFAAIIKKNRAGLRLMVVWNGDQIDGDHHNSHQLVTRNQGTQRLLFADCCEWFMDAVGWDYDAGDRVFFITGTEPTHGTATEEIARDFVNATPFRKGKARGALGATVDGQYAWQKLNLNIHGRLFNIAHHPSANVGRRLWTEDNAPRSAFKSFILKRQQRGVRVPDFYIRSHKHSAARAFVEFRGKGGGPGYSGWTYLLPAWQMRSLYVHKIGIDDPTDIGGFWCEVRADGAIRGHENEYSTLPDETERIVRL